MPNIRRRKDNRFEARIYRNNKSYSVYAQTEYEVKAKLKKLIKELNNQHNLQVNKVFTLNEWYLEWFKTYKKPFLSDRSAKNLEIYFKKHILPTFGDIKLIYISEIKIQKFLNELPKTRTKELITTYFKACLDKAKNLNHIKHDLFSNIVKEKKINNKRRALTYDEQVRLLHAIKNTDIENYIMFYLLTGVRLNEIYNVLEYNKEYNFIKVLCEKSDGKVKTIKVNNEIIEMYKKIKKEKMKTKTIYDKFKVICEKVNINATTHQLRHTYATNNYYLGTPIKVLQEWMGHSDIKITMEVYTNVDYTLTKEKIIKLYNNLYYEI